ncbi:MAG TPA: sensor histidine kinase [Anaerolineae bacterium]|nr:sensor histidine kinase [Anaerolineae bacterium]
MSTPTPHQPRHIAPPSTFSQFLALHFTVVAFAGVTLFTQRQMWQTGAWFWYALGTLAFDLVADRFSRIEVPSFKATIAAQSSLTAILLIMLFLSDFFFLTAMLSFLIVSVVQSSLPRRQAYFANVLLLGVLWLTYILFADLEASIQILLGLGAGFIFMIVFTQLATSEQQARRDLEKANAQLAEYAAQVEQLATVRERNRLAREVHDTLGHYLTVINVQLEVVTKLIDANPARAQEAAVKAKQLASEGLGEIRRSVAALRPSPLEDKPLPEAIRGLIETSRDAGLMVTFEQTGLARVLSSEMETVLYRALQESLTNIRKHAHASAASVCLAYATDTVSLRVRDNGVGRQNDEDSVGLNALRERVTALNGTVLAENHLEGGFVLEVILPVGHAA